MGGGRIFEIQLWWLEVNKSRGVKGPQGRCSVRLCVIGVTRNFVLKDLVCGWGQHMKDVCGPEECQITMMACLPAPVLR